MKRFLIVLTVFAIFLLVADCCFGWIMDYMRLHSSGGPTEKMERITRTGQEDILIMGSSRACHHYDPGLFEPVMGLSAYNAGFEGNGIVLMYGLLLLRTQNHAPKLIVYDVTPEYDIYKHDDDNNLRYLSYLRPYGNDSALASMISSVSKNESFKLHSNLYRYNSSCLTVANDFRTGSQESDLGYVPMYGRLDSFPVSEQRSSYNQVDTTKLLLFRDFIHLAFNKGIRIIVVASPKGGRNDSSVFSPLKSLLEEEGVPFWDSYYDESISTQPSLFNDPAHLNKEGAELFTNKLLTELSDYLDSFVSKDENASDVQ